MAGLVGSNLRSGSFKLVYDIISGLGRTHVGSVYSKFPEETLVSFPMTVLDNVDTTDSVMTKTAMNADITVPITLFNKSGKNLDIQVDTVITGLEGSRMAFMGSGVKLNAIRDGGQGDNTYGKETIHFKTLNVEFVSLI